MRNIERSKSTTQLGQNGTQKDEKKSVLSRESKVKAHSQSQTLTQKDYEKLKKRASRDIACRKGMF